MISKYLDKKPIAIRLRKTGESIRSIEAKLKIPKSTLSGWLDQIKLTQKQVQILDDRSKNALKIARVKAVFWHNRQKEIRISEAKINADKTLESIDIKDKHVLELALAMLYLGEGSKKDMTSLGNTNPLIVKFFLKTIEQLYKIHKTEIKYDLHLRSDQNESEMIDYWAKELDIPQTQFSAFKDKRTVKSRTYHDYKGVCVARCGKIAVQRKLGFIANKFCNKIVSSTDA